METLEGILTIYDLDNLTSMLDIPKKTLTYLSIRGNSLYQSFQIPKRKGGFRTILAPGGALKNIQRRILDKILDPLQSYLPTCIQGFRRGRSILDNAEKHVGSKQIIKIDLKDFFDNIKFGRVYHFYHGDCGFPPDVSWHLTRLCTYRNGGEWINQSASIKKCVKFINKRPRYTPQGAPTSPALSNLIFRHMHARLSGLAKAVDFTYTAYADDLTFSRNAGENPIKDKSLNRFRKNIFKIISSEGAKCNHKKNGLFRNSRRMSVTGIVVNEKPNVPKEYYRNLRAGMQQIHQSGSAEESRAVLRGKWEFLRMVNPERAESLRKKYPIF